MRRGYLIKNIVFILKKGEILKENEYIYAPTCYASEQVPLASLHLARENLQLHLVLPYDPVPKNRSRYLQILKRKTKFPFLRLHYLQNDKKTTKIT